MERTGVRPLLPNTFNVDVPEPFLVKPIKDAMIERFEYNQREEIYLKRCRISAGQGPVIEGVIMRPEIHERGGHHGPACLEIMAGKRLRDEWGVGDGDAVTIEIDLPS
jgi:CTP-dependent riboflavin kinase